MEQPLHTSGGMMAFHRARRNRGFSLIEMLVVIGIIGITAAISVPSIYGWARGSRMRTAQREVAESLQRVRNRAISRNTQYGVVFAIQNDTTYWIHQEDPRSIIDAATLGADAVGGRQPLSTTTPAADKSSQFVLPANIRFATNATDCPAAFVAGYAPNVSALRFDKFGANSVPGQAGAAALAAGTSVLANRIYYVAGADSAICLFDTVTQQRRVIRISSGGRIRMQQ